jgi:transcriptional regulator with XRE-family HTH domain
MTFFQTTDELELDLGENLKTLRLLKNIDQKSLAERAGVSVSALKNLENGRGSTLKTFTAVIRALGREQWLKTVAPVSSINPLTLNRDAERRQRARPHPRTEPG